MSRFSLLFLTLAIAGCGAPSLAPSPTGSLGALRAAAPAVDDLFADATIATPGSAVAVVADGRVAVLKGFGAADVAAKKPITPDTAFDLGAVSKSFAAMAALVLVERGKLSLDAPTALGPTVRQLLNHTSGLPDYRPLAKPGAKLTAAGVAKLVAGKPAEFPAGSECQPSPTDYAVLATVVEKAAGQPYATFLKQAVLGPMGMTRTGTRVAGQAKGYLFGAQGYEAMPDGPFADVAGDGGLVSTAADMAKWPAAWTGGKLVAGKLVEAAFTNPELPDGPGKMGFGFLVKRGVTGDTIAMHAGAQAGYRTALLMVPATRFAAVVLSNSKDTAALALADELMQRFTTKR